MKFSVTASLGYEIKTSGTILLNIHALRTPNQAVLEESFHIDPELRIEELISTHGENRFVRIDIRDPSILNIEYKAIVNNSFKSTDHQNGNQMAISSLQPEVFPYLYPSRYCQSDKLFRFANSKWGNMDNPYETVAALTDWIHTNVEYFSGSTNSSTSAYDTVTEQAGVCRDFAHLGIALCRALTIPARYFTGYAYKLVPQDFHACFEAYINGEWVIFDATKLAPLNGLIKIATGRDAADTAVANLYGDIQFNSFGVSCESLDENFVPLYYEDSVLKGLSYL